MPRKRATRIKKLTKPKKPEGDIGNHLDPEERRQKLEVFLNDFDMEVKQRLMKIEIEKNRIQSMIEKEINVQLSYLPVEIRNMNVMDFVAAGGTVEAATLKLQETQKASLADTETDHGIRFTSKKKERGVRKARLADGKTDAAPPSSVLKSSNKHRSKFQTPSWSRQLPAVWDTPAVTPKFDVNLPFTPGIARAPKNGERLMSLAGSPVDISATQKIARSLKHTRIPEEEEMDGAVSRVAAAVPHIAKTDIHKILANFVAAENH